MEDATVHHAAEAPPEPVEREHVAHLEADRQPAPASLGLRSLDRRRRDVDAGHVESSGSQHQRVLARATAAIEDRRRELAALGQLEKRRLWRADIPRRQAIDVCAVPAHVPMVRAIVVILARCPPPPTSTSVRSRCSRSIATARSSIGKAACWRRCAALPAMNRRTRPVGVLREGRSGNGSRRLASLSPGPPARVGRGCAKARGETDRPAAGRLGASVADWPAFPIRPARWNGCDGATVWA